MSEPEPKTVKVDLFVGKILGDAEKKANEILEEAKKSADDFLRGKEAEAKNKACQDMKATLDSAKTEAEKIKLSILSEERAKMRWLIPAAKEKVLQEVFDSVKLRMKEFTMTPDYKTFLEKLVAEGVRVLGGGTITVFLNERDSKLGLDLPKIAEKISSDIGVPTTIKLSRERISNIGGVVIKSADGKIAVDNTIEGLIERKAREARVRVARKLFAT